MDLPHITLQCPPPPLPDLDNQESLDVSNICAILDLPMGNKLLRNDGLCFIRLEFLRFLQYSRTLLNVTVPSGYKAAIRSSKNSERIPE